MHLSSARADNTVFDAPSPMVVPFVLTFNSALSYMSINGGLLSRLACLLGCYSEQYQHFPVLHHHQRRADMTWTVNALTKCCPITLLSLIALLAIVQSCSSFEPFDGSAGLEHQQNPALDDVIGLIDNLPGKYCPVLVKNTNLAHFNLSYFQPVDHVQGIAMIQNNYVIAQAGSLLSKGALLVVGGGENQCSLHPVGRRFPHCGGIQACGNVLAMSFEPFNDPIKNKPMGSGSEILFIDFSNLHHPRVLPLRIDRPQKYAGAVGIAYHAAHNRHYVVVSTDDLDLYGSNGLPLTDPNCRFTLLKSFQVSGHYGGGTNLLYEKTGRLFMAGLKRDDSGWETIVLSEIDNPGEEATVVKMLTKQLSKSGAKEDWAAGFRWGGGIVVKDSKEIDAIAVARSLNYGPTQNCTKVKRWTNSPWVRILHDGAYIAKFYLVWAEGGQEKRWESGKRPVGYERAFIFPKNARNVRLTAQSMTGLLGNKAWKQIIRKEIDDQSTYEFSGTTLNPSCKVK